MGGGGGRRETLGLQVVLKVKGGEEDWGRSWAPSLCPESLQSGMPEGQV